MQAALPAAADLELLPCHLCGLGLGALSAAQLEGLEALHRVALAQVRLTGAPLCRVFVAAMPVIACADFQVPVLLNWTRCGEMARCLQAAPHCKAYWLRHMLQHIPACVVPCIVARTDGVASSKLRVS